MFELRAITLASVLTALLLSTTSLFAAEAPAPTALPSNFQALPGPQAVVPMPTEMLNPDPDHVTMRFFNPPLEFGEVELDNTQYQTVRLSGESSTLDPGVPDLPRVTRLIMIGNTGDVELVITDQSFTIQSDVLPSPYQPLMAEDDPQYMEFVPPLNAVYQSNEWYPPQIATISAPAVMRDVRFVVLTIFPAQVNPVTHELRVYDNIEVMVENIGGFGENEIYIQPSTITPSFKALYTNFENFRDSPLDELPVFPGQYLIICNNDATVLGEAQKLINWRKRKGIESSILSWGITSGSTTAIRDSISARYNASGGKLEFVCLMGDPGGANPYDVPTHDTGSDFTSQYDNFFGCISGAGGPNPDPVPDVAVGRLPATSSSVLAALVNKTVNYESDPTISPDPDWFTRTWCAAHTSGIASNPSTKEYTRQIMLMHGVQTAYFNSYGGNVSETDIQSRLTTGISVFNHRMSFVGQTPSTAIDALPATEKLPFIMSVTCGTGDFESASPDISELWFLPVGQTPTSPKGAIGCVGIATLNTHVPYNNIVDAGTMYGFYVLDVAEQGNALISGKLQLYRNYWGFHSNEVNYFSYWTNLMGDPGVPVWRKKPVETVVVRPATINRGTNNVALTLTDLLNGDPIEGALVCLLKNNESFSRGYTLADGSINLPCTTATTGYLHVTITKDDVKPYLDSIQVVNAAASLAFNSRSVDDDNVGGTFGDNNDILNPGETIDLTVNLTNTGTSSTVTGISATLTSSSPGITISQAASTYPNIAVGANANNNTAFRFSVSAVFNNEPVTFFLNLTSSVGNQAIRLDFTPAAGDVEYSTFGFSGPGGNIDPSESGNLTITFRNSGSRSLISADAILRSLDIYMSVTDSVGTYGTVAQGSIGTNNGNPFAIFVSPGTYNGHRSLMQLVVVDANGFRDSVDFYLTVGVQTSTSPSGPDAFGYYAYDITETTPPAGAAFYEWLEIAPSQGGPGISLAMSDAAEDDDDYVYRALPFDFTFYGEVFTQITICSNGWIAFGQYPMWDFRNYRMGTPIGPPYMVAAYWDDLWVSGAANNVYYYHDVTNHWYVIEWRAHTQYTDVNEFFEIILYDPDFYPSASGNGKIKVQYQSVTLSPNSNSNDNDYASVGIQNGDHSIGLDYYYWNQYSPGSGAIMANRAIMFTTDATGQLNPSITVDTPNGAEVWFVGQPYNVTWSSTAISGAMDIALNRNFPGGAWENVFVGTANDGVQPWTVTGVSGTTAARIRILSTIQPSLGDTSDANFTLQMPQVTVDYPNGGELLEIGEIINMYWTAVGLGASTVSLNRNYPGGAWEVLDANAGSEIFWEANAPATTNARIRIIGNAVSTVGDTSDANFTIGIAPVITHDAQHDQAPGAATFVAEVTDELPGFTTKLFYRLVGAGAYDSLLFSATGNPNEFSAVTPALAAGRYEYYLRSTDTQSLSTYLPVSGTNKFDVGDLGSNWLLCDDGTAENYNHVNGPGFKWAVFFDPGSYPFALSGARFAICPTCPTLEHDRVVLTVYLADGPGGLPGTIAFQDTTGSPGNIIGGLPTGAAWADVITRISGQSLTLNGAFYISVENSSPRIFPVAFAHDTNSVRCHDSYYYDECEAMWISEDAATDNARPGNRMIRANGFALMAPIIVSLRSGNDVIVRWQLTGAPYYKVYAADNPNGPFNTLIGTSSGSTFTDVNAVNLLTKRFYQVRSTDTP